MSRDIVMTIKPRHIRNMRLGIKKYELRKSRPSGARDVRVWICESGTGGRIVASFMCPAVPEMTGTADTKIAELCAITAAEVKGYLKVSNTRLFGWLITDFEDFKGTERELHIVDFGLNRPPQSWCYAKEVPGDV